jgi:hypothetical protein
MMIQLMSCSRIMIAEAGQHASQEIACRPLHQACRSLRGISSCHAQHYKIEAKVTSRALEFAGRAVLWLETGAAPCHDDQALVSVLLVQLHQLLQVAQ